MKTTHDIPQPNISTANLNLIAAGAQFADLGKQLKIEIGDRSVIVDITDLESIKAGNLGPGLDVLLQSTNIDSVGFIKQIQLFDSTFVINGSLDLYGHVRTGANGYIKRITKIRMNKKAVENSEVICVFEGDLKPVSIGGKPSIVITWPDGQTHTGSINETVGVFKAEFHLTSSKMQKLREVFDAWFRFHMERGNVEERNSSPIFVRDGAVKCSYDISKMSVENILGLLRGFLEHAKSAVHFEETLLWTVLAPLHYELKTRAKRLIQAPNVFMDGVSRAGKTSLGDLFLGRGFDQSREQYYFSYNRIKTLFTLTRSLSQANLPCLIDDVPAHFFVDNAENLKSYCQTGVWGERGRGDQGTTQYWGMRSIITTTNDALRIDDDIALSNRNILLHSDVKALRINNRTEWKTLYSALPAGFLFTLFEVIFGGRKIDELVKDVEDFETSKDWIVYMLRKINIICDWFGIPKFPELSAMETPQTDNATEIAEAFVYEWLRIQRGLEDYQDQDGVEMRRTNYRSLLDGELKVEETEFSFIIHFTGGAYKLLNQIRRLNMPYRTATEFISNVSPDSQVKVENNGYLKNIRIAQESVKCFTISLKRDKYDEEE